MPAREEVTESQAAEAARHARMRRWLWPTAIGCAVLYALLVLIWYLMGQGTFWPIWATYAMGSLLLWLTWGAFGKSAPPSGGGQGKAP